MNLRPSLGDAMKLDQKIHQLASYDTSAGMIVIPEDQDQLMQYQKKIAKKFNHFKRLLQNNELSFNDLQNMVIQRSGPFPSKKHNFSTEEAIADAIEAVIKDSNAPEPDFVIEDQNGLNDAIKEILSNIISVRPNEQSQIVEGNVEDLTNNGITIDGIFKKSDVKDKERNNESTKSKQKITRVKRKPKSK